ncbi:caspase family protein [Hyphomonas sp.]|uniref:caspase family protein n=1 Tax=Hyphomonas sp. TaxID=87 RepID=UPI0025C70E6A|nr:caspase family protein [Hyphomonas sp.]
MFRRFLFSSAVIVLCLALALQASAQSGLPEIYVDEPLSGRVQNIVFDALEERVLLSDSEGLIQVRSTSDWSVISQLDMIIPGSERPSWISGFVSLSPDGNRVLTVEHLLPDPEAAIAPVSSSSRGFSRTARLKPETVSSESKASWPEVTADFGWLLMEYRTYSNSSWQHTKVAYQIKGTEILPAPAGNFQSSDEDGNVISISSGLWTRGSEVQSDRERQIERLVGSIDGKAQKLGSCGFSGQESKTTAIAVTEDGRLIQQRRDGVSTTNLIALLSLKQAKLSSDTLSLKCSNAGQTTWLLYRRPSDLSKNELWADDTLHIVKIDHVTGKVARIAGHDDFAFHAQEIGPRDSLLLRYDTKTFLYDSEGNERSFKGSGGGITQLSFAPASQRLSVTGMIPYNTGGDYTPWWSKGRVRLIDFAEGAQIWTSPESDCGPNGGLILICKPNGSFMSRWLEALIRPDDLREIKLDQATLGGVLQEEDIFADIPLRVSADGTRLLARLVPSSDDGPDSVVLTHVDLRSGQKKNIRYDKSYDDVSDGLEPDFLFRFSDDLSRHLKIGLSSWDNIERPGTISLVDTLTGVELATWRAWEKSQSGSVEQFSPDGTALVYRIYADAEGGRDQVFRRNADGTNPREILIPDGQSAFEFEWTDDKKLVIHTVEDHADQTSTLRSIDAFDLHVRRMVRLPIRDFTVIEFLDEDRVAVGTHLGAVHIFDMKSGEEQVRFYVAGDGDWIALTPEGYFNSSSEAVEQLLRVRINGATTGIDQYRERFFRPDIVQMAMNGQALPRSMATLADAAAPPRISDLSAGPVSSEGRVGLSFVIHDEGGGMGGLRLYNNDSAVLELAPSEVGLGPQKLSVRLKTGDNRLKLVAFGRDGTASSQASSLDVAWNGSSEQPTTLHVLAIGIDEFRNPVLNLSFAAEDAEVLAETIRRGATGVFDRVEVKVLTTPAQTTRTAILEAFKQYESLSPDDAFVFFVASHGSVEGAVLEDREFILYTSNVGLLSSEALREDAITQAEIKSFISNVPATRKLILLDTCHAGAIGDSLAARTRGVEEAGAVKSLSRVTGTTILAASMAQQQAVEGYNGHGLFTWTLLQALSGKAAIAGSDRVSNWNVTSYVGRVVPELAKQRFGREQFPTVNDAGRQFDLTRVQPGIQ